VLESSSSIRSQIKTRHEREDDAEISQPLVGSFPGASVCGLLSAKAPVFEEPKMSAAKLGNVRQHQLLEVLGYNSTRLGKEAKIVGM
jgi:hypothetical protein